MARFRKKPVEVEAVQFRPENANEIVAFLEGCTGWHMAEEGMVIPTLEGDHMAREGDYIIRGVKGEFYPCKPDIFEATYEPVEPSEAARAALEQTVAHAPDSDPPGE